MPIVICVMEFLCSTILRSLSHQVSLCCKQNVQCVVHSSWDRPRRIITVSEPFFSTEMKKILECRATKLHPTKVANNAEMPCYFSRKWGK